MNYLLDTNIVIIYSKNSQVARQIEADYRLFAQENNLAISIVTIGEVNSIAHQARLSGKRKARLNKILDGLYKVDIAVEDILLKYEEIDAFSQGRHQSLSANFSAKNMGKNDLWIADTASVLGVPLVTTDRDFQHLNGVFLELLWIDLKKYR